MYVSIILDIKYLQESDVFCTSELEKQLLRAIVSEASGIMWQNHTSTVFLHFSQAWVSPSVT